jgi:ribosomal peptide maturation radical SAM protein 1
VKVLLVSMPFAALSAPSTALSILKGQLAQRGVECHIAYPGLAFADIIGDETYELIAERLPAGLLAGEWVFASCLFSAASQDGDSYFRTVARCLRASEKGALEHARRAASEFLDAQLGKMPWSEYDVVGFTSSCEQNVASLAMARRVKQRHPETTVVFGGANWEGTMGVAQLERFRFVDIAFLGEADTTLPLVVDRLASRAKTAASPLADVPGIAYRDGPGVQETAGEGLVRDLASLATPDFSDFFRAFEAAATRRDSCTVHLWLQGSRGCWWAEHHPCRFCGLNGGRRPYRALPPERLLDDILGTVRRWPGHRVDLSDTVVSAALLDEVVPRLAAQPLGVPLSLEVRPELRRDQVRGIAEARGEIQIGIESLSEDVLRLMGKGSHVLECLRLLKWCRAEGLPCSWNLLFDIPGESDEHLMEMARLIPALHCLPAPTICIPMQLDRFSPFFDQAEVYGIEDVRPAEAYAHIYPWSEEDLLQVAYTFDFRRDRSLLRRAHIRRLEDEVRLWQQEDGQVKLAFRRDGRVAEVVEMRTGAEDRVVALDELDALLYAACDDIGLFGELVRRATRHLADGPGLPAGADVLVASRLRHLVDERVLVQADERYLSLAPVCAPFADQAV